MKKNSRSTTALIVVITSLVILCILIIALLGLSDRNDKHMEDTAPTTEALSTALPTDMGDATEEETTTEFATVEDGRIDYNTDIQERSTKSDELLSLNGQSIAVPCTFGDIRNKLEFLEDIPDELQGNDAMILHVLRNRVDTGVQVAVVNTSSDKKKFDDCFITSIIVPFIGDNTIDMNCLGFTFDSTEEEIQAILDEHDEYNFDRLEETRNLITYYIDIDELTTIILYYDVQNQKISHLSYEYVII